MLLRVNLTSCDSGNTVGLGSMGIYFEKLGVCIISHHYHRGIGEYSEMGGDSSGEMFVNKSLHYDR